MVDLAFNRYFDPRFIQFGLTALILKLIVYFIQSHINPNMSYLGPDAVTIRKGNNSAIIHLFGATLTSWIADGQEVLFVSKKSLFDETKAIRGGVPVVFPHFGAWESGPQHGFARITRWTIKDESSIGSESITLVLEDSDATRKFWNYRFRFEYTVTLVSDTKIKMDALIANTGEDAFPFTFLLHTYFSVPDVLFCRVTGLAGCTYVDKVQNGATFREERSEVTLSEFTDRIYVNTPLVQRVRHISGKRTATLEKFNLPDTVVWNPWTSNAAKMSDFGDEEWQRMVCVEAGAVHSPVVLQPRKTFDAAQIITVDRE